MKLINALLVAGVLTAAPVLAQDDEVLKPVVDEAAKINESAAKSQEKINGITDQIDSKLQQFKTLMKEIEGLEVYNTQLRKQINSQEQEMADLNSAIDEVSVVERQITPLMMRMIDGLAQFIELDMPFLPEERANRVADLRAMMDRADVAASEKFRRVMEAVSYTHLTLPTIYSV